MHALHCAYDRAGLIAIYTMDERLFCNATILLEAELSSIEVIRRVHWSNDFDA